MIRIKSGFASSLMFWDQWAMKRALEKEVIVVGVEDAWCLSDPWSPSRTVSMAGHFHIYAGVS